MRKWTYEELESGLNEMGELQVKLNQRIRELEAAFNLADEKWSTVSTKLEKAEAALARVRELPEKWRAAELSARTATFFMAADELEAALQEPEHE